MASEELKLKFWLEAFIFYVFVQNFWRMELLVNTEPYYIMISLFSKIIISQLPSE